MENEKRLLVIWPTGRCNLSCKYCYASNRSSEEMGMDTFRKALQLMGDHPFQIQFAGGEPLLKKDLLEEMLEYVKAVYPEVSCAVQTNGTLIDDAFARMVKKYRLAVGVSMDGRPEKNEWLRGKTNAATDGVRLLGQYGISLNLNTVVIAENVLQLADMVDLSVYLGNVRGIGLDLLRLSGRALETEVHRAAPKDLEKGLYLLKERLDLVNRLLKKPLVVREFQKASYQLRVKNPCGEYCFASLGHSFVVLPNGACYPCGSLAGEEKYYMGNVHTAVSPIRINAVRPQQCSSCKYRNVCSGGCPSRGLLYGGFDELDCLMKKITFQFAEDAKKEEWIHYEKLPDLAE